MTAQLFDFPAPIPKKPIKKGYAADFEAFWSGFPRKLNCSKLMASKSWDKLDDDERAHVTAVLPIFVRLMRGKDEQFICHPVTWLNQKRFETINPPPTATISLMPVPIDWPAILRLYRMTSNWKADLYGPAPGYPGCRIPAELLGEML